MRMWAKDPDTYSSGVTKAAYVVMKRAYAPADTRLRALIAREKKMPGALQEARLNIDHGVPIYTQKALTAGDQRRNIVEVAVLDHAAHAA
jgi:hypothetical protein